MISIFGIFRLIIRVFWYIHISVLIISLIIIFVGDGGKALIVTTLVTFIYIYFTIATYLDQKRYVKHDSPVDFPLIQKPLRAEFDRLGLNKDE